MINDNIILIIIVVLSVMIFIISMIPNHQSSKIDHNKTVVAFGNGTFQIVKNIENETISYNLINVVNGEIIAKKILKYKLEEEANSVYFIGIPEEKQYTILNYWNGQKYQYDSFKKLNLDEKLVFEKEEEFTKITNQ